MAYQDDWRWWDWIFKFPDRPGDAPRWSCYLFGVALGVSDGDLLLGPWEIHIRVHVQRDEWPGLFGTLARDRAVEARLDNDEIAFSHTHPPEEA